MTAARQHRNGVVAVVAPYYPPSMGGVQHYAERLVEHLLAAGHHVLVITTGTTRWGWCTERRDRLAVVRLPVLLTVSNSPLHPLWPVMVALLLRRYGVGTVITHGPVPGLADLAVALANRREVVLTYHSGSMAKGLSPAVDGLLRWYERVVLPWEFGCATTVVAVSPVALGSDRANSVIISPGVDLDRFTPPVVLPRPADPPTVLFVGRMDLTSRWKGVEVLLAAFARVREACPAAELRLVGSGDGLSELRAAAGRLGLGDAVTFVGLQRGRELVTEYRRAAVTVLPSLTASESFGMTLVEAMACGCPVVGTLGTGAGYVIDDERTGLLVPPGDPGSLAAAVLRLVQNPSLRTRLGAEASRTAHERFGWDRSLAAWDAVIGPAQPPSRPTSPIAVRTAW